MRIKIAELPREPPHAGDRHHMRDGIMPQKGKTSWVFFFGYLSLAAGVVDITFDVYTRTTWSIPHDMGTVVGETALILLGLTASTIGESLRSLEQRLDRLDSTPR